MVRHAAEARLALPQRRLGPPAALGEHLAGGFGHRTEHADDGAPVVPHRAVGEGVPGVFRVAVPLHQQVEVLGPGGTRRPGRGRPAARYPPRYPPRPGGRAGPCPADAWRRGSAGRRRCRGRRAPAPRRRTSAAASSAAARPRSAGPAARARAGRAARRTSPAPASAHPSRRRPPGSPAGPRLRRLAGLSAQWTVLLRIISLGSDRQRRMPAWVVRRRHMPSARR